MQEEPTTTTFIQPDDGVIGLDSEAEDQEEETDG